MPHVVWALAGGQCVAAAVSYTFLFAYLYLVHQRDLSLTAAGLVSGLSGIGSVAGNFTGGFFGDRIGHRTVLALAATVSGVFTALIPAVPIAVLVAALPMAAYGGGVMRVAMAALVAEVAPAGRRRPSFAVSRVSVNAGVTIGAPLGALIATWSYSVLFIADGTASLLFAGYALWVLRRLQQPVSRAERFPDSRGERLWSSLRREPAVLAVLCGVVIVDIAYREQYTTLPVFLSARGEPLTLYGWLIAVNTGLILLIEIPLTVRLQRRSPLHLIAAGFALVGLGFGLLVPVTWLYPHGGATWPVTLSAVVMMLVVTAGEMLYKATATAHVADRAPQHLIGGYQSLYAGASVSGVVLSPVIGSALYAGSASLLWLAVAVAPVVAGAVIAVGARRATALPDREALDASRPVV
ncbi:MAG TPA: MFS transporter [Jatrophihabitans sp.]|nr:MFS transporter [Jatrophihabitans sp.]